MRRFAALAVALFVWTAAAPRAHAGDFAFSIGRDLGAIDIVGLQGVTDVGTRIGYRFERFVPFATVDYARYSSRTEFESDDFSAVGSKGSVLTAGAGLRYLFEGPEAKRAIPYLAGAGFTVVPNFEQEAGVPEVVAEASSVGFMAGFGVDYYFSEAFSLGGEAGVNGVFGSQTDATSTWRGSIVQLYTGIELNFFL